MGVEAAYAEKYAVKLRTNDAFLRTPTSCKHAYILSPCVLEQRQYKNDSG